MSTTCSMPCLVFDYSDTKHTMSQTPTTTTTAKRVRNSNSHDASTNMLPEEMLVEIFSRLPAKSVRRFRCLSRSWAATLTSGPFVDLHLHQANHRPIPKVFATTAHLSAKNWSVEVLTKPCHGLVLLHRPPHGHCVYNPSTGELLPLPEREKRTGVSYGLGYCPATMEYKVVRLFIYGNSTPRCEVFTLDVSAHWSAVAQKPPWSASAARSPAVFCDGYLHFLIRKGGGIGTSIATLDIGDETFGSLTVPPAVAQDTVGQAELTVLDGCLCLCVFGDCCRSRSDVDPYCIWRLACREAGRWEKLYRVLEPRVAWPKADLLRLHWISPLEVYRAGNGRKKIVFATEEGVLAFDLEDVGGGAPEMLVSPVEATGDSSDGATISCRAVGLLEESLVPVGRTSEEIVYSSPRMKAWSDVLKWMPTRSVVALIRVCKEWRAVINSARFAETHALYANLGKSHRIELVDAHPLFDVPFYPLEFCERVEDEMMPFLFDRAISSVVCSKPCNGLILVSYIRYTSDTEGSCLHFLCNPSREYSSRIYPDQVDAHDSSLAIGSLELGYDPRTNKHVLVHLVCYDKGSRDYQLECYIKLTDTTTSWISISPPPRPVNDMRPAYAEGNSTGWYILNLGQSHRSYWRLMLAHENSRGANAIDVWTLEGCLWTMGYRIDLRESQQMYSSDETTLLAVDPEDGRILLSTGKALGYYDPETRALETIYHLGEHLQHMEFSPTLCQESLFRPRPE
ncbi:hypothetical protein QYE76_027694 [Lolium multiflorum]|uniref:F-box domain-containing protein n=1 Tax=Lolium multiflorum TaxID=4521 RepID=A0AAD8QJK5_LOLMU|nr:hypothetical protein QYE76_027694 [Lolium multiflorum]